MDTQIKPFQWADDDTIRFAVRRYFEDVLGISAPAVYLPIFERSGSVIHDYGSGAPLDGTLNGATFSDKDLSFNGSGDRVDFDTSQVKIDSIESSYFTVFSRFTPNGYGEGGFGRVVQKGSDLLGWQIYMRNTGGRSIRFVQRNTSAGLITHDLDPDLFSFGEEITFSVVVHQTCQNSELFFNGARVTPTVTGTGTFATSAAVDLIVGDRPEYDRSFDGLIDTIIIGAGQYTDDQIAILHEQPYAPIQPYIAPIYFDLSAGGTTAPPTTVGPTTQTPTTSAPTSLPPTTVSPTTPVPTTPSPTTLAPTTVAPTTPAPTTIPPTTSVPTTPAPTTLAPTTLAPTTVAPTTPAPTSLAPTTSPPTTLPPTTVAPTTTAPTTAKPTTPAPTSLAPTSLPPTTVGPTTMAPSTPPPTTLPPTTLGPTTLPPPTTAPPAPVVRRRGIKDFGFSFRDRWR